MLKEKKLCFVIMPIGEEGTRNHIYFKKVYEKIKEHIEKNGYYCQRADDVAPSRAIKRDILEPIRDAVIVIADLTDRNVNVTYELGIRHTLHKTGTIQIVSNDQKKDLPFDFGDYRTIAYPVDLEDNIKWDAFLIKLKDAIEKFKESSSPDNPVHDFIGESIAIFGENAIELGKYNELKNKFDKLNNIMEKEEVGGYEADLKNYQDIVTELEKENEQLNADKNQLIGENNTLKKILNLRKIKT